MMSTYEIVIAIFTAASNGTSPSISEVTTIDLQKVYLRDVDSEVNAAKEPEVWFDIFYSILFSVENTFVIKFRWLVCYHYTVFIFLVSFSHFLLYIIEITGASISTCFSSLCIRQRTDEQ